MSTNLRYTGNGTTSAVTHTTGFQPSAVIIKNTNAGMSTTASTISNSTWNLNSTDSSFNVRGDAVITGDLTIKGISILETLESINKRLAILTPNMELEQRWKKLRELRQQYIDLEKDILEKEQIINILKR